VLRGTSQNPDVYFIGRETVNKYYDECPGIVQKVMDRFAKITGRQYRPFDYYGAPDAENIVIIMGSGGQVVTETVDYLNAQGGKTGLIKVRLFRPFSAKALAAVIPESVKKIAVLDRTKEPGALGEPLYEDVRTAVGEAMEWGCLKLEKYPEIIGGRYGLGSAEFTPAMVKVVFENMTADKPKNHFVVGPNDDVTHTSLNFDPHFSLETEDVYRAMFYGLGADGTVGANKNSIKIIADNTDNNAQGYFVYDSKKAGAMTVSHLRFGKNPIQSPYLITKANFIACHNFSFLEKYDMLKNLHEGGTFLLTSLFNKDEVWDKLPPKVQKQIIDKKAKFYVIDAVRIAEDIGLGARINMVMQTAFFKIARVIDEDLAIKAIKDAIKKTYGSKGDKIVNMNNAAVDKALESIEEVQVPAEFTGKVEEQKVVPDDAPDFVKDVTATLCKMEGETLPVSKMPADGTWPTSTSQYEKRNIAIHIPVWNQETCTQDGICSLVCPHGVIRPKVYDAKYLKDAPPAFKSADARGKEMKGLKFTLQVAPEDCTGCGSCVNECPHKEKEAIKMELQEPLREQERKNWDHFMKIPETDPKLYNRNTVKGSQLIRPLFEFSGACAGCGETPYVKLVCQLFGDRAIIANATGCSSIYGGNLPNTPYCQREDGRGPTWNNSLFEDTAEVAFGMRLTVDKSTEYAYELLKRISSNGANAELKTLAEEINACTQEDQAQIEEQRDRVAKLREILKKIESADAKQLLSVIDYLVKKSVWGFGGDGWAYDIGYGGLDHVLALGRNVNLLVLDTEVYSNTGGQASKATPLGAVAQFAAGGKPVPKKDLGLMAMAYGHVYVASLAVGASKPQTVKAIVEAEKYNGPSLIICYSHCIAHGVDLGNGKGFDEDKRAVQSGYWPLYRFNPDRVKEGKNPLLIDSKEPKISFEEYAKGENRWRILARTKPEAAQEFLRLSQEHVNRKFQYYKHLAAMSYKSGEEESKESQEPKKVEA
jgi:pyruvate-ferredoxin/flavodoxin oxidoreductase